MIKQIIKILLKVSIISTLIFSFWSIVNATTVDIEPNIHNLWNTERATKNDALDKIWESQSFYWVRDNQVWWTWIKNILILIARDFKNLIFIISWAIMIFMIMSLIVSEKTEEEFKKTKSTIIFLTVWIAFMQLAYVISNILFNKDITMFTAVQLSSAIIEPIIKLMEFLAVFAFLLAAIYSFYMMVTAWWDDWKVKKWKATIINSIIWILFIKVAATLVSITYWTTTCTWSLLNKPDSFNWTWWEYFKQTSVWQNKTCVSWPNVSEWVRLMIEIINRINWFVWIIVIILVIYAWFSIFMSGWDDNKIKKAITIIKYSIVWIAVLFASFMILNFIVQPNITATTWSLIITK